MFTVLWLGSALDQLADLYVASEPVERERMASGVEALNRRLAVSPLEVGESRGGRSALASPSCWSSDFGLTKPLFWSVSSLLADTVRELLRPPAAAARPCGR